MDGTEGKQLKLRYYFWEAFAIWKFKLKITSIYYWYETFFKMIL